MAKQAVVRGFCVACGSRNVVQHTAGRDDLVQCRSCAVVSRDFNQRQRRDGHRPGFQSLDRDAALAMTDQVLAAFASPAVHKRLQTALDAAQGDVAAICRTYLPAAVDVFARVITAFGFAAGLEGVAASIEALQALARDDHQLVERLVAIRQVLTPTGDWIREDRQAEQLEQRRLEEQQAEQQRRETDERLAAEVATRNAALARLRAKKLALGFDPTAVRLPELVEVPARLVAAREGDRVRLRVNVRFSIRRQWFFNGKLITDDPEDPMRTGATACTLTLPRLTRRVVGDYHCECENEEGRAVTPATRVELVAKLAGERLAEKQIALLRQHLQPTLVKVNGGEAVAVCVASEAASVAGGAAFTVTLLSSETLAPLKLGPPIRTDGGKPVIAWSDRTQTLVVVADSNATPSAAGEGNKPGSTAVKPSGAVQVALYTFERPAVVASGQPPPLAPNVRGSSYRGAPGPSTTPARQLATQTGTLSSSLSGGVRVAVFLDSGRLLAVTDLHLSVAIFAVDPSQPLRLLHTIRSADGGRIASLASAADAPVLAIAFRNAPQVDVLRLATSSNTSGAKASNRLTLEHTRRHRFALAVHLAAVDNAGMFAAIAESTGCLKTWISVANLHTHVPNVDTPLRSRRRFAAHVGAVTGLEWTAGSSLLLSSGLDGFVRVWGVVSFASASRSDGASMLAEFHVGDRVLGMAYASETATLVTVSRAARGATLATIQSQRLPLLEALEAFRREQQLGEGAAQVQKLWRGHHTRVLLAELLGKDMRSTISKVPK